MLKVNDFLSLKVLTSAKMCVIVYLSLRVSRKGKAVIKVFDMFKAGQKIKSLRENLGYSPEKVANDIGISTSSYCKYESGLRISRDEVKEKIANYFNRSVGFIFFNY